MSDWTTNPKTGMTNDSKKFNELCRAVERLIRGDAHTLIAGRAGDTSRLIMAQLAHTHGLAPAQLNEARDAALREIG